MLNRCATHPQNHLIEHIQILVYTHTCLFARMLETTETAFSCSKFSNPPFRPFTLVVTHSHKTDAKTQFSCIPSLEHGIDKHTNYARSLTRFIENVMQTRKKALYLSISQHNIQFRCGKKDEDRSKCVIRSK